MKLPKANVRKVLPLLRYGALVFGIAAIAAAAVCFLAAARMGSHSPLDSPALAQLKARAAAAPAEDPVVEEAREMDLLARTAYFGAEGQIADGLLILAILAGLAIVCAKLAFELEARYQDPRDKSGGSLWAGLSRARKAYGIAGAAVAIVALAASFLATRDLSLDLRSAGLFFGVVDAPADSEREAAWPQFRGQLAGRAGPGNEALEKAAALDAAWKVAVPLPGFNSPVVWGDKVFLSGATADDQSVFCFAAKDGALLWEVKARDAMGRQAPRVKVGDTTGYAAPGCATDGRRVYAMFACGFLIALDLEGRTAWKKDFGVADNPYGIASSPCLWKDELVVQWHQADVTRTYAFHAPSGKLLWTRKGPPLKASWASPVVARGPAGDVLVIAGNPLVEGLDPLTGKPLFGLECLGGEPAPSPAYDGGILLAESQYASATAFSLGGAEPLGEKLWDKKDMLADIASPLVAGGRAFIAATFGMVSCVDAAAGKSLWQKRLPGEQLNSSPVAVGGSVFLCTLQGRLIRFANGDSYEETLSLDLGEEIKATPAISAGAMYIRSASSLIKLEATR